MSALRSLCVGVATAAAVVFGLIAAPRDAEAFTVQIDIYNDNGVATDFSAEVEVTCDGSGCYFTFTNTSPVPSNADESAIDQVLFQSGFGSYFGSSSIFAAAADDGNPSTPEGVVFSQKTVNAGTKPQGWTDPWTTWSEGYYTRDGSKDDGINPLAATSPDDYLTIFLAWSGAPIPESFLQFLMTHSSEMTLVAMHVNECNKLEGSSCAGSTVPIPGAVWLLGSALLGLFGFGGYRRRRSVF